jgi:O-antigen ligase
MATGHNAISAPTLAASRTRARSLSAVPLYERAFTISVLFLSTGATSAVMHGTVEDVDRMGGDSETLALWSAVYLVLVGLLWRRRQSVARFLSREWLLSSLVGLALLSVAWSDAPELTFRRGVALFFTTLFGVYLAMRYPLRQQLRLLGICLLVVVASSFLVAAYVPSVGLMHELGESDGAWRGGFIHKNGLGRMMVLAVIVFGMLAAEGHRRGLYLAGSAAALVLLWQANSKASLVVLAGLLLAAPFILRLGRPRQRIATVLIAAVLFAGGAGMWLYHNWGDLLARLERDETLTGRTALWGASLLWIAERPWFGYGYNGFWTLEYGEAYDIRILAAWDAPHAHNGLLDLALDFGLVGLLLFLAGFGVATARAIRLAPTTESRLGCWPLFFLAFFFLVNVAESSILARHNLFWILYVAIVIGLASQRRFAAANKAAGART